MTPEDFLAARLDEERENLTLLTNAAIGAELQKAGLGGGGQRKVERMWRDLDAKRRILNAYVEAANDDDDALYGLNSAVTALCCIWSDHPDFRQEWTIT